MDIRKIVTSLNEDYYECTGDEYIVPFDYLTDGNIEVIRFMDVIVYDTENDQTCPEEILGLVCRKVEGQCTLDFCEHQFNYIIDLINKRSGEVLSNLYKWGKKRIVKAVKKG